MRNCGKWDGLRSSNPFTLNPVSHSPALFADAGFHLNIGFLAAPASDFVTGSAIPVDGGFSIQG